MKNILIRLIGCAAFISASFFYAQSSDAQRPSPAKTMVSRPREIRTEVKREELSKKLLQRKNELRKEEQIQSKDHRHFDGKEKSVTSGKPNK